MAKKKTESATEGMSILDKIKKCSDFEILASNAIQTFTKRRVIPTPLEFVNSMLGGGIPFGIILDLFGPKGCGKSSFAYQTAANFQRIYPEGLVMVIDSETSIDANRVIELGLDPEKVTVLRGETKESGYKQILSVMKVLRDTPVKERVPIFVLWDSLNGTATDAQTEKESITGGGISEDSRVNSYYLKLLQQHLGSDLEIAIVLINQVSANIGAYAGGYTESGGNALQHDIHLKLTFGAPSTDLKEDITSIGAARFTTGKVKIEKTKLCAITGMHEFIIDNTKAGVIEYVDSFIETLDEMDAREHPLVFTSEKGRYYFLPKFFAEQPLAYQLIEKKYPTMLKTFYKKAMVSYIKDDYENDKGCLMKMLTLAYVRQIGREYVLQKKVNTPYEKQLEQDIIDYTKEQGWDVEYKLPQEYLKSLGMEE